MPVSIIDDSWYVRPSAVPERVGAGGVVVRVEGSKLLVALVKEVVLGDDHYVIPKGGVEEGETVEEAALREIAEETGLTVLTRLGHLGTLARGNFKKTCWQTSHYGIFRTEQSEGVATDPANYGMAWFSLGGLPAMFWPDEESLIRENEGKIVEIVGGLE